MAFWNVSVKPVRLLALNGNWIDRRFVISAGSGFVAGLKRSESVKRQRSGSGIGMSGLLQTSLRSNCGVRCVVNGFVISLVGSG